MMVDTNKSVIEKKMVNSYKGEYYDMFRSLFDEVQNGICIVDYDGKIVELNKLYAEMFGYDRDELLNQHYSQLISTDSHSIVEKNHYKIFNGTNILKAEEKVQHKNGTNFYVQTTNIKINDEYGNKLRITTAFNTSNRLRNELVQSTLLKISNLANAHSHGEELYSSIYKAISEFIVVQNFAICLKNKITNELEYPFTSINNQVDCESLLKSEFNYITEVGNTVILNGEDIVNLIKEKKLNIYETIPTSIIGIPLVAQNEILGSIIIKDYSNTNYSDEDIEFLELVAAHVSRVVERKNYEEEIIAARDKAEEALKIKSEFLAQISHEIRTPLNSILSFSSLIKNELNGTLTKELEETFNYIERGGNRLTRTIDLILNVSKSQNNQYKIELEEIDIIESVLNPLIKEFEGQATSKGLEICLENSTENLRLVCDQYSVSQLFANLIENAIKYTQKGSIKLKAFQNNYGKIQVDVCDTGIGITEEYVPKLFDPFSQEEQGYTRSYEGIGLGLSLVRGYADLNNAEVKVKSIKNKGSVFSVIFN